MGKTAAEPAKECYELHPGWEISGRLRKDQIDKDTSGRFVAEFSVTLVVFKPDDQTYDARDNGCKVIPRIKKKSETNKG